MEQDALQSRIFIPYSIFITLAFENISGLLMRWFYESCFHKSQVFLTKFAACLDFLKTDFCLRLKSQNVLKNDKVTYLFIFYQKSLRTSFRKQ